MLARRTRCDSVTRLVQTVYPLTAPSPDEADVLLDAYALWESERADDERRRRAILADPCDRAAPDLRPRLKHAGAFVRSQAPDAREPQPKPGLSQETRLAGSPIA